MSISRFPFLLFVFLLVISTIYSCRKETPLPPEPVETDINFLGHKGAGNNVYNDIFMENTLPSIEYGVQSLEGVEVDLQMSKDGTIWLFHDSDLGYNCVEPDTRCLILLTDSSISKIELCHKTKKDRLYKLQELIDYWNNSPNGFYISLEVKIGFHADTFALVGGKNEYLIKLARSLSTVLNKRNHSGKILVEVNSTAFCEELRKTVNDVKICLLNEEDIIPKINQALAEGYNGISCNYNDVSVTKDGVKIAQDSGLVVQLWTPYYVDELEKSFKLNPNFIQTDNIDAKRKLNVN